MLGVGSGFTLLDPIISGAKGALDSALGSSWINKVPLTDATRGTLHVFLSLVVVGFVLVMAVKAKSKFAPTVSATLDARTTFEVILDGVMGMMSDIMGEKNAARFLPLIGTLAIYIVFSNAMALLPGMAPPTDNLNTTVGPAMVVFVATHIVGVKENGLGYFKHFLGPILKWYALPLMILMVVIEGIGHLARPLSLSLRLFGNMYADHFVVATFLGIFPFVLPLPNMLLGCIVVLVQTLVFCLLSSIYIGMSLAHEDDHGHH
jgi:F-type H+-transporting ATPase subunit a